jgi:hypothetical protein
MYLKGAGAQSQACAGKESKVVSWRLDQEENQRLASEPPYRWDGGVAVNSVVCNWGPPVSGRFDEDYLDIWVAADDSLKPSSVALYGRGQGSGFDPAEPNSFGWRDVGEFVKIKSVTIDGKTVGMYQFSGTPVEEFVVRLVDHQGSHHYDNNGGYGVNYHLAPYAGVQLNCLRTGAEIYGFIGEVQKYYQWILVFPRITRISGGNGRQYVAYLGPH